MKNIIIDRLIDLVNYLLELLGQEDRYWIIDLNYHPDVDLLDWVEEWDYSVTEKQIERTALGFFDGCECK
tara:strand:- start:140 stop:349 length:210 start_codon:yes stop_codon:yes gene_type:complete